MSEVSDLCKDHKNDLSKLVIVAASKTHRIELIEQAYDSGIKNFGENYLQEAEIKIASTDLDIIWHFIGSIQTRKCKKIAALFDWVHTLERIEVAKKLDSGRAVHKEKLNVCVQVNIDNEDSKSGIAIDEVDVFVKELQGLNNLKVRGLMAIPDSSLDHKQRIFSFRKLKNKFNDLRSLYKDIDTLSMGMSGDYGDAIKEGSTMVRIGTGIFGKRL
jgi:PLP dependent protein